MPASKRVPAALPATPRWQLLSIAALVALACGARAQDARHEWPEGSAMHTLYVETERLEASRATLAGAHAGLLAAFDDAPHDPSPLARLVASQHAQWLAYSSTDCELAGMLTGAGGAWPHVHAQTCRIERITQRSGIVDQAASCLRQLPTGHAQYERDECLQGLVDWTIGGN